MKQIVLLICLLVINRSTGTGLQQRPPDSNLQCCQRSLEAIANLTAVVNRNRLKVCPSGFEYYPEADACYKVIFQSFDWHGSGQVCRSVMPGVHLAAITSAAKQRAIRTYLEKEFRKPESSICQTTFWPEGGKLAWISGQNKDPNRCDTPYYWKTLNAVEIPFTYTNWSAGEPNCGCNAENCAHIAAGRDYCWNDIPCSLLTCALCEY